MNTASSAPFRPVALSPWRASTYRNAKAITKFQISICSREMLGLPLSSPGFGDSSRKLTNWVPPPPLTSPLNSPAAISTSTADAASRNNVLTTSLTVAIMSVLLYVVRAQSRRPVGLKFFMPRYNAESPPVASDSVSPSSSPSRFRSLPVITA